MPPRRPHSLSVDLPADVVELLGPTHSAAGACLRELALVELYRRGEVFGSAAADILGISLYDFIKLSDSTRSRTLTRHRRSSHGR
jgi:hypothetical protein